VDLPFVSFRDTYTFRADGAVIVSESTLRFRGRDEVASSLAAAGYRILDIREAPDRPGREYVFVTQHKDLCRTGPPPRPGPLAEQRLAGHPGDVVGIGHGGDRGRYFPGPSLVTARQRQPDRSPRRA
jgi:hypothetical protein